MKDKYRGKYEDEYTGKKKDDRAIFHIAIMVFFGSIWFYLTEYTDANSFAVVVGLFFILIGIMMRDLKIFILMVGIGLFFFVPEVLSVFFHDEAPGSIMDSSRNFYY